MGRSLRVAALLAGVVAMLFAAGYAVDFFVRRQQPPPSDNLLYLIDGKQRVPPAEARVDERSEPPAEFSFFETLSHKDTPEELDHKRQQRLRGVQRDRGEKRFPVPIMTPEEHAELSGDRQPADPAEVVYTIQLGSFLQAQGARDFSERLAAKGYEPYIIKVTVPDRGVVYRVRMGRLKNLEQAQKVAKEFEQQEKMSVLITSR